MMGRRVQNWFSGCSIPALPSLFYIAFLTDCARGEGLWTTKCLSTVVVGKEGHATCEIPVLQ